MRPSPAPTMEQISELIDKVHAQGYKAQPVPMAGQVWLPDVSRHPNVDKVKVTAVFSVWQPNGSTQTVVRYRMYGASIPYKASVDHAEISVFMRDHHTPKG